MKNIISLFLFLLISLSIAAQNNLEEQMEGLLKKHYQESETGTACLISKNGKILFENYQGYANLEHKIKVNAKSKFLIGSLTKQFTAAAILLLEEQGLLSTKDFIENYIPNASKDIYHNIESDLSPEERIRMLINEPLLFTPGEQFDYSNNGYIILGLIIEKVSGKSYADFLEGRALIFNKANGYWLSNENMLENAPSHPSTFSAGGILSTPRDLNKWVTALFSNQVLSEKTLKKMLQNYALNNGNTLNNGYGWEINKIANRMSYEHSGSEPGYKAYSIFIPKDEIYIITCQNTSEGSPSGFTIHGAALASNKPYLDERQGIQLSKEQCATFIGTYLFDANRERVIGLKDNQLYFKAPGGLQQTLYAINDSTLILKNGYRQFKFSNLTDTGYTKIEYSNRIYHSTGQKTCLL